MRIVPPIAAPLVAAHAQGVPLAPVLQSITNELRFDHFLYGVSSTSIPDAASRAFAWTSLPEDWLREYEVARYIELDPRLRGARESTLPFLWDARTCAHTAAERAFFAAAARHGVCSGVAIALRHRCDAPPAKHGGVRRMPIRDQRSRNVVASWSCRGFTRYDRMVRSPVPRWSSAGMPGTRTSLPSLARLSAGRMTRTR